MTTDTGSSGLKSYASISVTVSQPHHPYCSPAFRNSPIPLDSGINGFFQPLRRRHGRTRNIHCRSSRAQSLIHCRDIFRSDSTDRRRVRESDIIQTFLAGGRNADRVTVRPLCRTEDCVLVVLHVPYASRCTKVGKTSKLLDGNKGCGCICAVWVFQRVDGSCPIDCDLDQGDCLVRLIDRQ